MDDRELEALLTDLESDRVERKESLANPDKVRHAICAFANDLPDHRAPGVVFVGARDDGSSAGLTIDDDLLKRLSEMRNDVLPIPTVTVQRRTLDGAEFAAIEVEPVAAPPARHSGRVYVRVGPTTRVASPEDERRLAEKRRARDLPFDVRPAAGATMKDLDLAYFTAEYLPATVPGDVLAQNSRTTVEQLQSLRLVTVEKDPRPTNLGVLTLGVDVLGSIPGAWISCLRVDGTELPGAVRDNKTLDGRVQDALRRLDEVLEAQIRVAVDFVGRPREIRTPDYPLAALQQLARNAVMHRSYEGTNAPVRIYWFDDRVEIHNPGGPYGQVTKENFGQPGAVDYRNRHLAEVMANLGFVQKFGFGIVTARKALEENGNPPLEFQVFDERVVAVVRARQ